MSRRRDLRVEFWCNSDELSAIQEGASAAGMTVSAWLRLLALREARVSPQSPHTAAGERADEAG